MGTGQNQSSEILASKSKSGTTNNSQAAVQYPQKSNPQKSDYGEYCRPLLEDKLTVLGLNKSYHRAQGQYLYSIDDEGKEQQILDLVGGFGSTILGHNHPAIKREVIHHIEINTPIHTQASHAEAAGQLGRYLNEVLEKSDPNLSKKYIVHQANSGTEAVEAAIKHALMAWGEKKKALMSKANHYIANLTHQAMLESQNDVKRAKLLATISVLKQKLEAFKAIRPILFALEGSFHGKTAGSISPTANESFKTMYPENPIATSFLSRNEDKDGIVRALSRYDIVLGEERFSAVIGVIFELIQGEGGVVPLTQEFVDELASQCQKRGIPKIVDEIQSGIYRTGTFLTATHYGIVPEYITLGKSLGGGMCKIAACLIDQSIYIGEFGLVHTSTFAEDSFTSNITLKAQKFLRKNARNIAKKAEDCEDVLRRALTRVASRYPGVIKEVRGKGFFLAVEFYGAPAAHKANFFEALTESGYLGYFISSYLLNHHQIRVTSTLSNPNTIRIQPSVLITVKELLTLTNALQDVAEKIFYGHHLALSAHLWPDHKKHIGSKVSSFLPKADISEDYDRVAAFTCHFIDKDHARMFDPMIKHLTERDIDYFYDTLIPLMDMYIVHEQVIKSKLGPKVLLKLYGIGYHSKMFQVSPTKELASDRVRDAMVQAISDRATHIGLGQFTSIATRNGLLVGDVAAHITTGNSLTAGLALEALKKAYKDTEDQRQENKALSESQIVVIGACGNIGSTMASILADEAKSMTLIHHERFEESSRFQECYQMILKQSAITKEALKATHSLEDVASADIVVIATSATTSLFDASMLKKNAVVLDVSVPRGLSDEDLKQRPDVFYLQGGLGQLPLGQKFDCKFMPVTDGQIFACMAETVLTGLENYQGNFSFGPLSKESVMGSLALAKKHGVSLGHIKTKSTF